jgi:hypothetical protein
LLLNNSIKKFDVDINATLVVDGKDIGDVTTKVAHWMFGIRPQMKRDRDGENFFAVEWDVGEIREVPKAEE